MILVANEVSGTVSVMYIQEGYTISNKQDTIQVTIPSLDTNQSVKEVTVGIVDTDKAYKIIIDSINDIDLKNKIEQAILNDEKININVVVENLDVTKVDTETKAKIDNEIKKEKMLVAQYLDLSIKIDLDGEYFVTQLDDPITYTIVIPADLVKEGREFAVVRVHGDQTELLPTTMNADGTITFETDCFSTYALVYKDAETKPETSIKPIDIVKPNETEQTTIPTKGEVVNTSDQSQIALYASLCTLAFISAGIMILKKKRILK